MTLDLTAEEILVIGFDLPKLIAYYTDMMNDPDEDEIYNAMTKAHVAALKSTASKIQVFMSTHKGEFDEAEGLTDTW